MLLAMAQNKMLTFHKFSNLKINHSASAEATSNKMIPLSNRFCPAFVAAAKGERLVRIETTAELSGLSKKN
jgi:hypothetical protein